MGTLLGVVTSFVVVVVLEDDEDDENQAANTILLTHTHQSFGTCRLVVHGESVHPLCELDSCCNYLYRFSLFWISLCQEKERHDECADSKFTSCHFCFKIGLDLPSLCGEFLFFGDPPARKRCMLLCARDMTLGNSCEILPGNFLSHKYMSRDPVRQN